MNETVSDPIKSTGFVNNALHYISRNNRQKGYL